MQAPLQALVPELQTHTSLTHDLPLPHSSVMQQALLAMQRSPQRLKPFLQAKSQAPSQVASEFDGTGQVTQSVPHAVGSSSAMQRPSQWCVPLPQVPSQASPSSMQAPKQSFWSDSQLPPQDVASSQVASPPVGA